MRLLLFDPLPWLGQCGGPPLAARCAALLVLHWLPHWLCLIAVRKALLLPGRFLIRPSDSLFSAPQSDLEKKSKHRSKGLGEERPNPGCFWFTAVGGRFFWQRKNFRVASLGSEWQKMAHTKLILCVSNKLFY
jgi:hypothetical protein